MGKRISTWSLITYLNCPQAYQFQFGPGGTGWSPTEDKQKDFSYGRIIHSVLQEAIFTEITFEESCASLWRKLQVEMSLEQKEAEFLYWQGATWLSKLWQTLPKKEYVEAVEKSFSVDVGTVNGEQYYITGRYDLLLHYNDIHLIADFKTRSKLYDDLTVCWDHQLSIYSWAFWRDTKELPFIRFYDLEKAPADDPKNIRVRITTAIHTPESTLEMDKRIQEAIQGIASGNSAKKSGFGCSWCANNNKCFATDKAKIEYL